MTSPSDVSGGQISHPGDQKKEQQTVEREFFGGGKKRPMS